MTLLLYDGENFETLLATLTLDPLQNKTGRIWHTFVPHRPDARYYAYRVDGPRGPLHRFDAQKVLLDPFARQVFFPPEFSRAAAMKPAAESELIVPCRYAVHQHPQAIAEVERILKLNIPR